MERAAIEPGGRKGAKETGQWGVVARGRAFNGGKQRGGTSVKASEKGGEKEDREEEEEEGVGDISAEAIELQRVVPVKPDGVVAISTHLELLLELLALQFVLLVGRGQGEGVGLWILDQPIPLVFGNLPCGRSNGHVQGQRDAHGVPVVLKGHDQQGDELLLLFRCYWHTHFYLNQHYRIQMPEKNNINRSEMRIPSGRIPFSILLWARLSLSASLFGFQRVIIFFS